MTNNKEEEVVYPSIGGTFNEIGNDFSGSIPHVILGKDKNKEPKMLRDVIPGNNPGNNVPENPMFNPKENDVINKIKKWALIAAVLLIVGYAAYRILKGVVF